MSDQVNPQPPNINDKKAPDQKHDTSGYLVEFNLLDQNFLPATLRNKILKKLKEQKNKEKAADTNSDETHQPHKNEPQKLTIFVPNNAAEAVPIIKRIRKFEKIIHPDAIEKENAKRAPYEIIYSKWSQINHLKAESEKQFDAADNFSAALVDMSILAMLIGIRLTGTTVFSIAAFSVIFPLYLACLHAYRYNEAVAKLAEPDYVPSKHDKITLYDKRTLVVANIAKAVGLTLRGIGPHGLRWITISSIAITAALNINIAFFTLAIGSALYLTSYIFLYKVYTEKYNYRLSDLIKHVTPQLEKIYYYEFLINLNYFVLLRFALHHPTNKILQPFRAAVEEESFAQLQTVAYLMHRSLKISKSTLDKEINYYKSIYTENLPDLDYYITKKTNRLNALATKATFAGLAAFLMLLTSLSRSSLISQKKLSFIDTTRYELIVGIILIEVLLASAAYELNLYAKARNKQALNTYSVKNQNLIYFELACMIVFTHVIAALVYSIRSGNIGRQNLAAAIFLLTGVALIVASEVLSKAGKTLSEKSIQESSKELLVSRQANCKIEGSPDVKQIEEKQTMANWAMNWLPVWMGGSGSGGSSDTNKENVKLKNVKFKPAISDIPIAAPHKSPLANVHPHTYAQNHAVEKGAEPLETILAATMLTLAANTNDKAMDLLPGLMLKVEQLDDQRKKRQSEEDAQTPRRSSTATKMVR